MSKFLFAIAAGILFLLPSLAPAQDSPELTFSPNNFNFGEVLVGSTKDAIFTLTHSPDSPADIAEGTVAAGGPFLCTSNCTYSLLRGRSQTLAISFMPEREGSFPEQLVRAGGQGVGSVRGTGVKSSPYIISAPDPIDFGTVQQGQTSTRGQNPEITLVNNSSSTFSGSISVVGTGFSLQSSSSFSVPPGQSQDVHVAFTAPSNATGKVTGSVTVSSPQASKTIGLTATVTQAQGAGNQQQQQQPPPPTSGGITGPCKNYCDAVARGDPNPTPPPGTACLCNPLRAERLADLINNILRFIFIIAVVVAPLMVVIGGFLFVTGVGNPQQIAQAKGILIWTAIGFGVILFARGLTTVLRQILGG